jgi:hypothetical protein
VLLQHYSAALWKSIEQKTNGDELVVTLGWHAPVLPAPQPAALSERVVVPGEMAVAQMNLGVPVTELLLAMTDVLKAPLDREAIKKEVAAQIALLTSVNGLDPRAVTVSAGPQGVILSLHNKPVGQAGAALPPLGGAVEMVATKWGVALSPMPVPQLLGTAVSSSEPGAPIAGVKLLDRKDAFVRAYVDVTKLPAAFLSELPAPLQPVKTVAIASSTTTFDAEVGTASGAAKGVAEQLVKLIDAMVPPDMDEMYKDRAKLPVEQEVLAIMSTYQRGTLKRYLTPAQVTGDKIVFHTELSASQSQLLVGVAVVGVAAAVAIPAFMAYQFRAAQFDDLPRPHDPDLDPQGQPTGFDPSDLPVGPDGKQMTAEELDAEIKKMQAEMEAMQKAGQLPPERELAPADGAAAEDKEGAGAEPVKEPAPAKKAVKKRH